MKANASALNQPFVKSSPFVRSERRIAPPVSSAKIKLLIPAANQLCYLDGVNDLVEQLSESQRTCLRLVAKNKSSKEIAIETGLSPQTVDQYLARAASLLGASNRRDAARRFTELTENALFRKSELKTIPIANLSDSDTLAPSLTEETERSVWERIIRLLPAIGGQRHDLTATEVIYAVLRLSLFTTGAVAAIIGIIFWLNRLAT